MSQVELDGPHQFSASGGLLAQQRVRMYDNGLASSCFLRYVNGNKYFHQIIVGHKKFHETFLSRFCGTQISRGSANASRDQGVKLLITQGCQHHV